MNNVSLRTSSTGSVSVWAAVAERRFFELMTERKNVSEARQAGRR